jgi:hypothetical protein
MSRRANRFPSAARHAARKARQSCADERAETLPPIVKALQAAGVTSLNGIAEGTQRAQRVHACGRRWLGATQVRRVLARLPAQPTGGLYLRVPEA